MASSSYFQGKLSACFNNILIVLFRLMAFIGADTLLLRGWKSLNTLSLTTHLID